MVRLCVGGGHVEATTVGGTGGADISLRSLDVTGHLTGEVTVSKSNAEGLAKGIDNALNQIAADEADKVRVCLEPVRARLLDLMLPTPKAAVPPAKPPSFESVFEGAFPDLLNAETKLTFQTKDPTSNWEGTAEIRFRLYYDFRSDAEFVSIYLPSFHDVRFNTENIIKAIRDEAIATREQMNSARIIGEGKTGVEYEESSALMFPGRVFIFTLNPLTAVQMGELSKWYEEKSLHLKILGTDYWTAHWQNPVQTQR